MSFYSTSILLKPALAMEKFKVSSNERGNRFGFKRRISTREVPNENYKLGKKEKAIKPEKDAFGDVFTSTGGIRMAPLRI